MYISHYETKIVLNSNLMIATFLIIRLATLKKLCYEESLVSSNLNSKLFWFHCVRPNIHTGWGCTGFNAHCSKVGQICSKCVGFENVKAIT